MTDSRDSLFRRSAIEHYLATDERGEVIRISPPWTWAVVGVMTAAVGTAILLCFFSRIEITGRSAGLLRTVRNDYRVTSFLPEKDRNFVKVGDVVTIDLDAFPSAEFGTLRGSIVSVAGKPASPAEASGPSYRVEIAVQRPLSGRLRQAALRNGMATSVRYTLRRERLIVLLFSPLRRWFHE